VTAVLQVDNVSMRFGGVVALRDVSLELRRGEILGLIGPNGSGKTTLVNIVSGFTRPLAGACLAMGRPITGMRPSRIARQGVVRTFQNLRIFKRRTVLENMLIGQASQVSGWRNLVPFPARRRNEATDHAREMLRRFGLQHKAEAGAGDLSFGEQKRLELARALAARPQILLLDEPAGGMNPSEIDELKATLAELRADGLSILLIEHNMRLVMSVSDRVACLCFGELIAQGTPEAVRADPQVIRSYLGQGG
jgi:branched-chain amino acid transport system ATP-binding protein